MTLHSLNYLCKHQVMKNEMNHPELSPWPASYLLLWRRSLALKKTVVLYVEAYTWHTLHVCACWWRCPSHRSSQPRDTSQQQQRSPQRCCVCVRCICAYTHTHTPVHIMLFSACTHSCINSLEKHYLMCLISCWGRANLHVSSCPVLHSDVSAAHHFLVCVAEIPLSMQPSDECQEPGAALWQPAILTFG